MLGSPLLTLGLLLLVSQELAPLFFQDADIDNDNLAITPESVSQNRSTPTSTSSMAATITIPKPSSSLTKIVGFADQKFQEMAWTWYQEMEALGYTEHWIAAHDSMSAEYFRRRGVQRVIDLDHNFTIRNCPIFIQSIKEKEQKQIYRRSLFARRWKYLLSELQKGQNILMTDVDNIFTQYVPLSELEESESDVFHAFAGTIPSFPRNLFRKFGFTLCGCLSWWRAIPGVMDFVKRIVQRCHCDMNVTEDCECMCDDQVVLNNIIFKGEYAITWDQKLVVPSAPEDLIWNKSLTGVCNATGHKVQVWERYRAYRAAIDPNNCPVENWVAMPTGNKSSIRRDWKETCG
jgi:hypothetical protein